MDLSRLPTFVSVTDMTDLNLGDEFVKLVCQELVPIMIYKHNPVFAREEIEQLIKKTPKKAAKSITFVLNEDDRNKISDKFSAMSKDMIETIVEKTTQNGFRPIKVFVTPKEIPISFHNYYYNNAGGMSRNALLSAMTSFYARRCLGSSTLF